MQTEFDPASGVLFLVSAAIFLTWMFRKKHKTGKINDLEATVDSDRRTQAQYQLRQSNRKNQNLIIILVGVLISIIFIVIWDYFS